MFFFILILIQRFSFFAFILMQRIFNIKSIVLFFVRQFIFDTVFICMWWRWWWMPLTLRSDWYMFDSIAREMKQINQFDVREWIALNWIWNYTGFGAGLAISILVGCFNYCIFFSSLIVPLHFFIYDLLKCWWFLMTGGQKVCTFPLEQNDAIFVFNLILLVAWEAVSADALTPHTHTHPHKMVNLMKHTDWI